MKKKRGRDRNSGIEHNAQKRGKRNSLICSALCGHFLLRKHNYGIYLSLQQYDLFSEKRE